MSAAPAMSPAARVAAEHVALLALGQALEARRAQQAAPGPALLTRSDLRAGLGALATRLQQLDRDPA